MAWDKARLGFYIGCGLAFGAVVLSHLGLATYDSATGDVDIHPFNVWALAGVIAPVLANLLAMVAVWLGWGRKK